MKTCNPKIILFDIDNTLVYGPSTRGYYARFSSFVEEVLSEELGITLDAARDIANEHRRRFNGRGEAAFLTHGISADLFYDKILTLDPREYILPAPRVKALLAEIQKRGILIGVITDGPTTQGYKVLAAAGIDRDTFELFIGWERGGTMPKGGSSKVFERILGEYGILPEEVLMVGDSLGADILPAQAIGCRTLHVGQKKTVEDVLDYLA